MSSSTKPLANKCIWCKAEASLTCGKCNQVYYCGKEHQKNHWAIHKTECKPYKIVQTATSGRYLVSTRFLPAGSLILKESPFAIGPKASSPLLCLSCHSPITENNFLKCDSCQWPMCSLGCSKDENHQSECRVLRLDTKRCGVPHKQGETPRYDLILILRCLLLRSSKPSDWTTIQNMESHSEKRQEEAEPHHVAAIRYLTEVCKVDFDVDTVHHVRGAIVTNSINTQSSAGAILRGLYATVSLLNHSCYPNITLRSDKSHTLYIRTSIDVQKDEPLLFSYIKPTDPIWDRQRDLKDVYYFSCKCQRCEDPSEMGTYFSSPKCPKCGQGYIIRNPANDQWQCTECDHQQTLKEIMTHALDLLEWINHKKIAPKHLRLFLKGMVDKSHDNHFIYFETLQKVLAFLKDDHSQESNQLKKEIWEKLLEILSVIEQGQTRRKGISLLEYVTVILNIYKSENNKKRKSKDGMKALIETASRVLEEASIILDLEPTGSTEDYWREFAKSKLKNVLEIKKCL